MAATSTYSPPPTSLARDIVEAFFTLIVGVFLQIGRFFRLLVLKVRRALARRALYQKAVAMGRRMEQADAGDHLLLQQARTSTDRKQRDQVLARVGELGLETGVPLLGLEEDHQAGHQAYRHCRQVEYDHDETAYLLCPHSSLGWFALLASYVLTPLLLLLLFAFVFPNRVPVFLARLVGRTPTVLKTLTQARFDGVQVEVIGARVSRSEVWANGKVVMEGEPLLFLQLRITNHGNSPMNYRSWRGRTASGDEVVARVIDDRGATLHRIIHRDDNLPKDAVRQATLGPGKSVEDVLVYAPPVVGFKRLDLYLPGQNIGAGGEMRQVSLTADQVETPGR
jgi:hypothetical protein